MGAAMVLKGRHILRREGAVALPDGRVLAEREDVLDVELKFVDLPLRKPLDELVEGVEPLCCHAESPVDAGFRKRRGQFLEVAQKLGVVLVAGAVSACPRVLIDEQNAPASL